MNISRNIVAFLLLFFIVSAGFSQTANALGNHKDWAHVSTENFDVFFSGNNEQGAALAAKYAELARYDLGVLFDYKPTHRFTLFYASDPQELITSNLDLGADDKVSSVFHFPKKHAYIVHPGTSAGLYEDVKLNVAKLILREFAYGDRVGTTLQTRLLLYDAPWFNEGLAEWVATGWTYEDELWMQSVQDENLLSLAIEGESHINQVVRKSIWHFITHEYGEQKISEILYLVNISHSIESGIISVLGITLNTLTYRWQEYMKSRARSQVNQRISFDDIEEVMEIPSKAGYEILSFSYNESINQVALVLGKNGKQTIFLYDISSRKLNPTSIRSGIGSLDANAFSYNPPIAWNKNGTRLATVVYRQKSALLVYYDLETKSVESFEVPTNIQKIRDISWSNDGSKLVVSALSEGHLDIFITPSNEAAFTALTKDGFDDIDPVWSFDDQSIFFSSNRKGESQEGDQANSFQSNFDLYQLGNLISPQLTAITETPEINETQPIPTSSFELTYISDESGINNLHKVNIFLNKNQAISNLAQGIAQLESISGRVAISTANKGLNQVLLIPATEFTEISPPQPTLLRLDYLAAFQSKEEEENLTEEETTDIDEAITDETTPIEDNEEEVTTIETIEEDNEPVKYYIFDEEDEPYEAKKSTKNYLEAKPATTKVLTTVFGDTPKPKMDEISTGVIKDPKSRWAADYLQLGINYDPLAKMGMELGIGFSDLLNNHKLEVKILPFFNLKNSMADIRYSYLKGKIDFFAQVGYQSRNLRETNALQTDSLIFRYDQIKIGGGAKYPLSSFAEFEVHANYYSIDRKDQQLRRPILLNDQDNVGQVGLNLHFDKVREREGYAYSGIMANIGFDSYYSFQQSDFAFHRFSLNVKHYWEVFDKIVLASQITSAFNTPRELSQFYMGGVDDRVHRPIVFQKQADSFVRNNLTDTSLYNVHFLDFVQDIHGFRANTRNGSRYVMANLELRIPLSRFLKNALPTSSLYNLEIIPFVDAGTVWENGNPFNQKKPTDTQVISRGPITVQLQTLKSPFLIGFGSGVRTNILSWSLRMDIAWGVDDYTIQRPIFTTSVGKNF